MPLPLTRWLRLTATAGLTLLAIMPAIADAARLAVPASAPRSRACIYTAHNHATLRAFERLVGHRFSCAVVFNDAAPDWQGWERPWFIGAPRQEPQLGPMGDRPRARRGSS